MWYVVRGIVTALRTCNALVVFVAGLNAARLNVPETAPLAPGPKEEQSAKTVATAAAREGRNVAVRMGV